MAYQDMHHPRENFPADGWPRRFDAFVDRWFFPLVALPWVLLIILGIFYVVR
jgi:hypothetical protein